MIEWKDVLQSVGSTLGSDAGDCILDFLRIVPEEVIEGRKINLTVCSTEQQRSPIFQQGVPEPQSVSN